MPSSSTTSTTARTPGSFSGEKVVTLWAGTDDNLRRGQRGLLSPTDAFDAEGAAVDVAAFDVELEQVHRGRADGAGDEDIVAGLWNITMGAAYC